MNDDTLLAAWRRHLSVPLTLASLVFLVAWALPILVVDLDARWQRICWWATWLTWALFAVDYLTQLVLTPDRRVFVRRHLFDLAVIALPILRPLQLLRVIMVLYRLNHSAAAALRGNIAVYGTAALTIVLLCASLVVLRVEGQHPDANLLTFGDALWWSVTTVSTVGYGDFYPVTLTGRLVATTLFLVGVALIGIVTGTLATWLTERVAASQDTAPERDTAPATRADVLALTEEVRALRARLAELEPAHRERPAPPSSGP